MSEQPGMQTIDDEARAKAAELSDDLKTRALDDAITEDAARKGRAQAPIKLKDAVGRKFTFPFEVAKTWKVR
jgi:hypothetical protein